MKKDSFSAKSSIYYEDDDFLDHGIQRPYFKDEDYDAFDTKLAESEDQRVIAARKEVVVHRFLPLFEGIGGEEGIASFLRKKGPFPHWNAPQRNLTNVYWPFPIANGGWVDYLRMGFGKQREFIYELARLSGVFSEVSDHGTRDQIAFHYVTQLQISLSEHGWSVNLYMDKKAWLEQRNLYNKLQDKNSRKEFIHILDSLLQEGFISSIIYHDGSWEDFEDAREFLREFTNLVDQEESFSFLIGKHLERYSPENHAASILSWVKDQMQILLGAYNYTAWHPSANNYLEF